MNDTVFSSCPITPDMTEAAIARLVGTLAKDLVILAGEENKNIDWSTVQVERSALPEFDAIRLSAKMINKENKND